MAKPNEEKKIEPAPLQAPKTAPEPVQIQPQPDENDKRTNDQKALDAFSGDLAAEVSAFVKQKYMNAGVPVPGKKQMESLAQTVRDFAKQK